MPTQQNPKEQGQDTRREQQNPQKVQTPGKEQPQRAAQPGKQPDTQRRSK